MILSRLVAPDARRDGHARLFWSTSAAMSLIELKFSGTSSLSSMVTPHACSSFGYQL